MFKEKTVFVLGAGSSHEFGMPLGEDLKKIIANKLDFKGVSFEKPINKQSDELLFKALKKFNFTGFLRTSSFFKEAINTYRTIDEFLASDPDNKEFQTCGKLAIIKSILDAEFKCQLSYSGSGPREFILQDDKYGTYLGALIRQLTSDITRNNFEELFKNVSFINFNYDRCLEKGLIWGLKKRYPFKEIPNGEFDKWVKSAKILRPYGSIGSYWSKDKNYVPFGGWDNLNEQQTAAKLIELVDGIKTFSEENSEIDNVDLIQEEIFTAKNIVFLGFHFYSQNLKLLSPGVSFLQSNQVPQMQTILATVYQRSDSDKARLKEMFVNFAHRIHPNKVILEDSTCYDLFKNNQLAF